MQCHRLRWPHVTSKHQQEGKGNPGQVVQYPANMEGVQQCSKTRMGESSDFRNTCRKQFRNSPAPGRRSAPDAARSLFLCCETRSEIQHLPAYPNRRAFHRFWRLGTGIIQWEFIPYCLSRIFFFCASNSASVIIPFLRRESNFSSST